MSYNMYAKEALDILYWLCYYNSVRRKFKMKYEVYVNSLSIIDENEDLENNVITIDCEEV